MWLSYNPAKFLTSSCDDLVEKSATPSLSKLEMLPLLLVASLLNGAAAFYLPGTFQQFRSVEFQLMLSYRSRAEGLQQE